MLDSGLLPLFVTGFSCIASCLLAALVWIGNRLIHQFDGLVATVTGHGQELAAIHRELELSRVEAAERGDR